MRPFLFVHPVHAEPHFGYGDSCLEVGAIRMTEFEDIRPYHDAEVPAVLRRLLTQPEAIAAAATFAAPWYIRWCPLLARRLTHRGLTRIVGDLRTVEQFQNLLARYFQRMIDTTTDGFSCTGTEHLAPDRAYVFVSNHRDITLDSGFINYALHSAGLATSRIGIGDNLIGRPYATDLMRLNKSFVIRRNAKGTKAAYAAMALTSRYIRHSLHEGESVWIAQREGRAKDGLDRTAPAVIKMLGMAYRDESRDFREIVPKLSLVPVAVSYEIDPCDRMKAHELTVRAATAGHYEKPEDEDLRSIVAGITGYKGRVHLAFTPPLAADLPDADAVAAELDRQIVGSLRVFPTHVAADRWLEANAGDPGDLERRVTAQTHASDGNTPSVRVLARRVSAAPPSERYYLLLQYANVVRNRCALGFGAQA